MLCLARVLQLGDDLFTNKNITEVIASDGVNECISE